MFYLHCSPCSYIACMWLYVLSSVKQLCFCALKQIKWILITTVHGSDFITQVFGHVMGRTLECRYLMGQKATLSRLEDLLELAADIDFSSKLSPCFLLGLWWNLCQAGQMWFFAWAQTDVNFQFVHFVRGWITVRESLCVRFALELRYV